MTEIQGGRWDKFLRKLFPVKGQVIAPNLAPELTPIVEVQPYRSELEYLIGDRLCGRAAEVAAVAGNYSCLQLSNPADSGHLVIVDGVHYGTLVANATMSLGMFVGATTAPNAGLGAVRDTRWPGGGLAAAAGYTVGVTAFGNTVAAASATIFLVRTLASNGMSIMHHPGMFVISPGYCFEIRTAVVNIAATMSILWREREFEPSEA